MGLLQREVAERLGVAHGTLTSWELSRATPSWRLIPQIIRFLGYDPGPARHSLGEQLKAARYRAGLTQERLALLLGVDPGTLSRWERNLRVPAGRWAELTAAFLEGRPSGPA